MCDTALRLRAALYAAAQQFTPAPPTNLDAWQLDPVTQFELTQAQQDQKYQNALMRLQIHRAECPECAVETWGKPRERIPLSMPVLEKKGA